jgi:predicted nucleotide-binding protein
VKKTVKHPHVFLDEATIRKAITTLRATVVAPPGVKVDEEYNLMMVHRDHEGWVFDSIDELIPELVRSQRDRDFSMGCFAYNVRVGGKSPERAVLEVTQTPASVSIEVHHKDRGAIERVHEVFRTAAPALHSPPPERAPAPAPKPRVFIGHGGKSTAWRDLKDHLADKHHYDVVAYETGARAGHTIRDILEEMLGKANFAILVMTAEDEQADSKMRARQNVVHEAGLFQGKLGFARAIIVIEDGVENLSNLDGVQYLPFKHTINETFGEVLATIKREFDA